MILKFISLTVLLCFVPITVKTFPSDDPIDLKDIKNIPDLYFECQIAQMSENSGIPLFYNHAVREYIELYLTGRKKQIPQLSGFSEFYFPLFDSIFKKTGIPSELKYIAIIESGLDRFALSNSGAYGLWQFKSETAKSFGLEVNDSVDERTNPLKSTKAACLYLKNLNSIFNDWQLSLLAYHAGPTTIRNAIIKASGKRNYNEIYPYLPVATQKYLPSFIAVMYVMNNYKKHI